MSNTSVIQQTTAPLNMRSPQTISAGLSMPSNRSVVYKQVDVMPKFPGGDQAMDYYLQRALNIDSDCIEELYEDSINVSFIIDEYGGVNRVNLVEKDLPPCIRYEVLRAIQDMPTWIPGQYQGRAVKVLFTKPLRFRS